MAIFTAARIADQNGFTLKIGDGYIAFNLNIHHSLSYGNANSLKLSQENISVLADIGGVFDKWSETILIPCTATISNGDTFENSLILVTKVPPHRWYPINKIRWASDIIEISPSQFALPIEVRGASYAKEEISMGFAPIDVIDSNGQRFTLGARSDFFNRNGVKGRNLTLEQSASNSPTKELGMEYGCAIWAVSRFFHWVIAHTKNIRQPRSPIVWPLIPDIYVWVDWNSDIFKQLVLPEIES